MEVFLVPTEIRSIITDRIAECFTMWEDGMIVHIHIGANVSSTHLVVVAIDLLVNSGFFILVVLSNEIGDV